MIEVIKGVELSQQFLELIKYFHWLLILDSPDFGPFSIKLKGVSFSFLKIK